MGVFARFTHVGYDDSTMTSPVLSAAGRSRGMRDLLPDEMRAFRRVEDAFRSAATRWGYDEIRTPTIETYNLFTRAGTLTPQMLSHVYTFLDWDGWSGERVVLRPDSTIPVARAAAQAGLPQPSRLFYVQNVFRFHENEDDREEWQCGIEYLGAPAVLGELEVASIACETLLACGFEPGVRLSHVGVMQAVLEAANGAVPPGAFEHIAAEGPGAMRQYLIDAPAAAAFVEVALHPAGGVALLDNLSALATTAAPAAIPALAELRGIAAALTDSGRSVTVDLSFTRGFEYYTGVVFDFVARGESWGGGGRYKAAGVDSACGLGIEAERLAKALAPASRRNQVVAVVPESDDDLGRALQVTRALHRSGIAASLSSMTEAAITVVVAGDSLRAQTPAGTTGMMTRLDDLVELLVQAK